MAAKILVVDDSATDRLIIKQNLSEYSVLTACDGIEAMNLIDDHKDIDIVILDLNMPNMDGFQVLNSLKSSNQSKNMRIIILTSYEELDNEIKGLKMGAVDYIRKPINVDSLKARIDIHLEMLKIQRLYEQKLHDQDLRFDTIFQQAPIGITISHNREPANDLMEDYYSVNPMLEKMIGRTKNELIELGWEKISHPEDLVEDLKNFQKLQSGEINSYSMDKRYIKPDGSFLWAHIVVAKLELANDYKLNHICFIQDISKRKNIENALVESERSKSVLLSHIPGLAYRCNFDENWTMQYVSDGCLSLTGYSPESLLYNRDISFNDLITLEYRESLRKEWNRILAKRIPFKYEYEIITAKGERKWVLELGHGIYNEEGEVEALEGIILDISDRKEIENDLRYNSEHDTWTGLYNRRYLENLLLQDTNIKTLNKRALISVNLGAIYSLSMTYGFYYSKDLIKKVAESLLTHCSDKCQLFSTFEYSFVFYINDYKGKNELIAFCENLVITLKSVLDTERIGGGIGIIEIDEDNINIEKLLKNLLISSEKALSIYNRDFGYCFFNIAMEEQIIREEDIKRELSEIAEGDNNDSLFLQFQPILDVKSNRISDFEALARINSKKLGLITPNEFIPIAEKTKLIIPLGNKIIIQAFDFLNKLKENGFDTISVSINISVIQLLRDDFIKNLCEMINEKQVNPTNIIIEITESFFSSDYQVINRKLSKLNSLGIKIAIDDFGTGYSSLAREYELNTNILKIDKYFSDKLLEINNEDSIICDIISMIHKLGHIVIAEGIEHEKQRQYMIDNGCDKLQGYLISRPLDEEAAIEFLKKQ